MTDDYESLAFGALLINAVSQCSPPPDAALNISCIVCLNETTKALFSLYLSTHLVCT